MRIRGANTMFTKIKELRHLLKEKGNEREQFKEALEEYVPTEVSDPLDAFHKECICGGTIMPIYDDNPHFGSVCNKCD